MRQCTKDHPDRLHSGWPMLEQYFCSMSAGSDLSEFGVRVEIQDSNDDVIVTLACSHAERDLHVRALTPDPPP